MKTKIKKIKLLRDFDDYSFIFPFSEIIPDKVLINLYKSFELMIIDKLIKSYNIYDINSNSIYVIIDDDIEVELYWNEDVNFIDKYGCDNDVIMNILMEYV